MIKAYKSPLPDPTAAFGVDILQCLKITLHEDITLDDLETAMEVFSLDKAYYLSQGHDAARADRRWSCVKSAIRTAVFQRDGLVSLTVIVDRYLVANMLLAPP